MKNIVSLLVAAALLFGCTSTSKKESKMEVNPELVKKAGEFVPFTLTTDFSVLTEKEKQILPLLLEASILIDELFWQQAYGNKDSLLAGNYDEFTKKFIQINYGPWERLNDNKPFVHGFGEKPAGARFYPVDMTKEEFEAWQDSIKTSLYTVIKRKKNNQPFSVPFPARKSEKI